MSEDADSTKITVRVPKDLHRRLKITLAHDGRSLQEILTGMIDAWVQKKEAERE